MDTKYNTVLHIGNTMSELSHLECTKEYG